MVKRYISIQGFSLYRRLQNVCNRKVKSEKATAFLIWMILLFSVVRLTTISEQSEPRFSFSVAYILQSPVLEIAECLQQNAKSEKVTAFLIWKALLFSVVALTAISEHLHHRIYCTVANILQSPVWCLCVSMSLEGRRTRSMEPHWHGLLVAVQGQRCMCETASCTLVTAVTTKLMPQFTSR